MIKASYLSLRQRFLRWSVVLVILIAGTALLPQPAQASNAGENHCITPNGIDLNVLYGISDQIVTTFCNQVDSGEHWTAGGPLWLVNTNFAAVPDSFLPAGATPLEDFRAKFVAIKYVIDPGTRQEQTYVYPTGDKLWTGTFFGFPVVWPGTLSSIQPLNVGEHVVDMYWVFNAMHCNGFSNVSQASCLGPGEIAFGAPRVFYVTPGAVQSQE
jgi:hypothetical protein